jgi:hypothetical protein
MTTFTIDPDNNITAHPSEAAAVSAASGESFASQEALNTLTAGWPMDRFVTVWNTFAGVAGFGADLKPVKKFENRDKAVARIWKALQRLNGDEPGLSLMSLALAASPVCWTHYQLLQYPGVASILCDSLRRRLWKTAAAAVVCGAFLYQIPVAVLTAYYHHHGGWTGDSLLTLYIWTSVTPIASASLFALFHLNLP